MVNGAQTDPEHAYLLAGFLAREIGELRPWTPVTQGPQTFWQLLRRHATLVRAKLQWRQSLTNVGTLNDEVDSLLCHCVRMFAKLECAFVMRAEEIGWSESIAPNKGTLASRHKWLQWIMGWTDTHAHEYEVGDGVAAPDWGIDEMGYGAREAECRDERRAGVRCLPSGKRRLGCRLVLFVL